MSIGIVLQFNEKPFDLSDVQMQDLVIHRHKKFMPRQYRPCLEDHFPCVGVVDAQPQRIETLTNFPHYPSTQRQARAGARSGGHQEQVSRAPCCSAACCSQGILVNTAAPEYVHLHAARPEKGAMLKHLTSLELDSRLELL